MNDQANYNSGKKTQYDYKVPADTVHYEFDVKDSKGRAIGANISTRVLTYTEIGEANPQSWSTIEPGTFFAVRVQATRDGKSFGACQSESLFKSDAGRLDYIKRYLADARKRALKNAGADLRPVDRSVVASRRESGEWAGDR